MRKEIGVTSLWPGWIIRVCPRWPEIIVGVAAIAAFGVFLYTVIARSGFPYEYNWIESDMLEKVTRVLNGLPLYAAPNLTYASDIYTPLYYFAGAAILTLFGETLAALRVLSHVGIVLACVYIALFVYRETRRVAPLATALGMFGLYYGVCDGLLDIARVDALFLSLLLATIYHGKRLNSRAQTVLVTALWLLSFHTKQTALFLVGPLVLYWLYDYRNRGIFISSAVLGLTTLITIVLSWRSSGWYWFYAFEYGQSIPRDYPNIFVYIWRDLLLPFWPALIFSIGFLGSLLRTGESSSFRYYACILAAAIIGTGLTRTHIGSGSGGNILIPLSAILAIFTSMGWTRLLSHAEKWKPISGLALKVVAVFVMIAHIGLLAYRPSSFLASKETVEAWELFERKLAESPGDVFVSRHGFLAEQAGKRSYANASSLMGLDLLSPNHPVRVQIESKLYETIETRRFSTWFLHRDRFLANLKRLGLEKHYGLSDTLEDKYPAERTERTVPYCGPTLIYIRRE